MEIQSVERKGHVLSKPTLKCLSQVAAINTALGCVHQCVYCYARGYAVYPGDGKVFVYENMPEKLRKELPTRRKLPRYVFFSPACDALQPVPQVLDVTYELMRILFEHGIGVNLLTKGSISQKFLQLFKQYRNLAHIQIGITTVNRDIQKKLEPYAAAPQERVKNIEKLCAAGIVPEVKLDPLIPGVTNTEANLLALFRLLRKFEVNSASVNYLFLRTQIKKNLIQSLANTSLLSTIMRHYKDGKAVHLLAERSQIFALNTQYRKQAYENITNQAKAFGIHAYVCGCKNPDITEEPLCGINWGQHFEKTSMQKHLF